MSSPKRSKISHGPSLNGGIVTISTELDETVNVHKDLLVQESRFAAARFSSKWDTPPSPRLLLPKEFGLKDIQTFAQWLYTRKIHTDGAENREKDVRHECSVQLDLYLLGEYLQCTSFCNDVMLAMHETVVIAKSFVNGTARRVYRQTSAGSAARKFLVDMHVYLAQGQLFEKEFALPGTDDAARADFLHDVAKEMSGLLSWQAEVLKKSVFKGDWVQRYMVADKPSLTPSETDLSATATT